MTDLPSMSGSADAPRRRWFRVPWFDAPVGGTRERTWFVLLFAAAVMVRVPSIVLQSRFWGEDGPIFFGNAFTMPWWRALLAPYGGYLQVIANLSGLLAHYLAPLLLAPYVTMAVALVFQCVPAMLIAFSREDWLQRRGVMLAALALVAAVPLAQETWLNALNSQYHLTLAAGIILSFATRPGRALWFDAGILLLAALSSPQSWFLAPVLGLRAIADRTKPRTIQAAAFFLGMIAQLVFFFSVLPDRKIGIDLGLLGTVLLGKMIVIPLSGHAGAVWFQDQFASAVAAGAAPLWPWAVLVALFALLAGAAAFYWRQAPLWLLTSGAIVAACSCATAWGERNSLIDPQNGGRYLFAAQALVALAVLGLSAVSAGRVRAIVLVLAVWLVVIDAANFFYAAPIFSQGPRWRAEVRAWQRDPTRRLQTWPTGWNVAVPAPGDRR